LKHTFSRFFGGSPKEETAVPEEIEKESIQQIRLDRIRPNQFQPRTIFVDEKIEELAQTIRTHGIIQPIVVRPIGEDNYEIVAGERRYRAMELLEWEEAPVLIKEMSDRETASVALIENLQREQLTAIEEANAYYQLLHLHELTQEALAQRLGKSQSTIANKLRLLKLPEEIQQAILKNEITERHARALLKLKEPTVQIQLLQEALEEGWSVRQLEEKIIELSHLPEPKRKKPMIKAISKDMRIALNTIRQSADLIKKSGLPVEVFEEEEEEYYTVTMKIKKTK